jgi:exopolyphosphatase/guanosine-5'-triphosphate,3'-diphosphate pyrophosphatase
MKLYLLLVSYSLVLNACASHTHVIEANCTVIRAAFDVGSSTTKMKVGKIDKCLQKNLEIVYHHEVKVPFAENRPEGSFNSEIRQKGIAVLQYLKKEASNHGAQSFAGVATEAFRSAANSSDYTQEVKRMTKISIELISQDKEAILGYFAAVSALGSKPENTIVWDIGGSSMQIVLRRVNHSFLIYRGKLASISFKEKILTDIQHYPDAAHVSPNPIGKENMDKALKIAMIAAAEIPEEIKKKINDPDTIILGIGGVHNESIKKQLHVKDRYNAAEIINTLKYNIGLSDKDIGGSYADTETSNLILVLGFMNKLSIDRIYLVDVNLADGVLIDPTFW